MEPRFAMRQEPTMAQAMATRAWQLIVRRDIDLLEITYGLLMVGWGVQLLMPWETFITGAGYRVLALFAPEWVWGVFLIWVGVTKIGAYLLNHWRVRCIATLGACMIWTFFSVTFGLGNPYGTGIVVYPVLAFTSALIFWRLYTHRVELHA